MKNKRNEITVDRVKLAIYRLEDVRDNLIVKMSKGSVQAQSYLGLVSTANKDIEYLKTLLPQEKFNCSGGGGNAPDKEVVNESDKEVVNEPDYSEGVYEPDEKQIIIPTTVAPVKAKGRPKGSTNVKK